MVINTYPSHRPTPTLLFTILYVQTWGLFLHRDGSVMSYKSSSSQVLRNLIIEELQIKGITDGQCPLSFPLSYRGYYKTISLDNRSSMAGVLCQAIVPLK